MPGNEGSARISEGFVKRWTAVVLSVAAAAALLALAPTVLLMLFAGVLVGLFLDRLVGPLCAHLPLRRGVALGLTLVVLLAGAIGLGGWILPSLWAQGSELWRQLPEGWAKAKEWVGQWAIGREALGALPEQSAAFGGWEGVSKLGDAVTAVVALVAGVGISLALGSYLALNPSVYTRGAGLLVPPGDRGFLRDLMERWHRSLGRWTLAKLASMLVVASLTAIGLAVLGVPLVMINAVLAGLLSFVPNFGPIASVIPPVLLVVTDDPSKVLWIIALYIGIQLIESYLITPNIMRMAVHLPQALILVVQLLFGALFGFLGLLLAVPLGLAVMVAAQTWINHRDGDGQASGTVVPPDRASTSSAAVADSTAAVSGS